MGDKEKPINKLSELRKRAQVYFSGPQEKPSFLSQEAVKKLVHELDTYQIELELQNEDLRHTQIELDQSRKRFSDLYEYAPVGYLTVSEKGLIVEANLTAAEMLGFTREDLLKKPISSFIVDDDQDIFYLNRQKLLETQKNQTCELRMKKRDSSFFYVQMENVIRAEMDGQLGLFRSTLSDITIGKEFEAKLQGLKERYRSIVMDQYDLICRFDPQGKITFVNDAYCKCFDVHYQDILGTNFLPNVYKEDLDLVEKHFADLSRINPNKTISHRVYLPSGNVHWQQWCGRAFFDNAGNLTECQVVGRDITEQEEYKAALRKAHDDLEQRVAERTLELQKTHAQLLHVEKLSAIGQLSSSIAHEFNNPLQGVMTVLKGIKRRAVLEQKDLELVDMAVGECNRMRDLIRSLQDFNRPTSGRNALIDLHELLDNVLLLGKNKYKTTNVNIKKRYTKKMPLISAVNDQIKQVFINLLNNAADACEDGGTITVETVSSGENVVVRIHDTGVGIQPENMDTLFRPFFTTKAEGKGTGLGLSISYGIIKEHGGEIDVESEIGKGAIFSVTLPVHGGAIGKENITG